VRLHSDHPFHVVKVRVCGSLRENVANR
jgi:hypothetical protein